MSGKCTSFQRDSSSSFFFKNKEEEEALERPYDYLPVLDWADFFIGPPVNNKDKRAAARFSKVRVEISSSNGFKNSDLFYSLKSLHKNCKREELDQRARQLKREASILAHMTHTNIIEAKGVSAESSCNHFILLEYIQETVHDRLNSWRKREGVMSRIQALRRFDNNRSTHGSFHERMQTIIFSVASALKYLHSKELVLRNLSPCTIGITSRGQVKLYDLQEACFAGREVTIRATAHHRSNRPYMSPEDAKAISENSGKNYNVPTKIIAKQSSDVYSFGFLLWEVATLGKPYVYAPKKFATNMIQGLSSRVFRPRTWEIPAPKIRRLVEDCWDVNPDFRPTLVRVWLSLSDEYKPVDGLYCDIQRRTSAKLTKERRENIESVRNRAFLGREREDSEDTEPTEKSYVPDESYFMSQQ